MEQTIVSASLISIHTMEDHHLSDDDRLHANRGIRNSRNNPPPSSLRPTAAAALLSKHVPAARTAAAPTAAVAAAAVGL